MTVQEFFRPYFGLGAEVKEILVQRNDGSGHLKRLYSSLDGYNEQLMRPEVRVAEIEGWGIDRKCKRIWVTVC